MGYKNWSIPSLDFGYDIDLIDSSGSDESMVRVELLQWFGEGKGCGGFGVVGWLFGG